MYNARLRSITKRVVPLYQVHPGPLQPNQNPRSLIGHAPKSIFENELRKKMTSLGQNNAQTFRGQGKYSRYRRAIAKIPRPVVIRKVPQPLNKVQKSEVSAIVKRVQARTVERHLKNVHIDTAVGTTGVYYDISSITQGDAYNQRDGNVIHPFEVGVTFLLIPNETPAYAGLRVVIFRWLQDTTVEVPSDSVLFENFTNDEWMSPFKGDTRNFAVLFDQKISAVTLEPVPIRDIRVTNRGRSLGTPKYEATATTGRDHIYLLLISDNNVNTHTVVGHHWIRWTDA